MTTAKKGGKAATKPANGQPKLIEGAKGIETAINSIASRGKKLDMDIQIVGLSVLAHVEKHGDVTLVNRLYAALPQGSRRRALAEWLMAFGKLTANTNRTEARTVPFVFDKSRKTDMEGAINEPWYTFAPEPEVVDMFDVVRALHMLLGRAKRANKVNDMGVLVKLQQIEDSLPPQSQAGSDTAAAAALH